MDIQENENELLLTADVPGISLENIDISIEDGALTLSGERKFENEENKGGYHRIERSFGGFKRVFTLPDSVDAEKVSAAYNAGVLKVTLPKKEAAKPRTIKVNVNK
ncbi:MAG: Hsp20/alpha crystallin family protein [Bryobacterales bacterium]|nr:Hsp20/alpha crystallin family protein [Bryobacterales bacterium]